MIGVGNERCTDAQHELGVDFTVRVLGGVEERYVEFRGGDFAVGHGDVGLQLGHFRSGLTEVGPFHVFVLHDTTGKACAVALGDGFGQNEGPGCDVEVFFFLGVDPFNNALDDEGTEVDFTAGEFGEVVLRQAG